MEWVCEDVIVCEVGKSEGQVNTLDLDDILMPRLHKHKQGNHLVCTNISL